MPAESHIVSTAADLASQVRARRVDPVAITSATLARIAGDSRAVAAFRRVRRDEALAEAAALADRSDLGELAAAARGLVHLVDLIARHGHLRERRDLISTINETGTGVIVTPEMARDQVQRLWD